MGGAGARFANPAGPVGMGNVTRSGVSPSSSSIIQLNKNVSYGTAKRQYWKSQGSKNGNALRVNGKPLVLHHPFGRGGDNLYKVQVMTQAKHIEFHKNFGAKAWKAWIKLYGG